MHPIRPQTWLLSICLAAVVGVIGCVTNPPEPTPPPAPWQHPTPDSNGIPNLSMVEDGLWRGGQPNVPGFAWLAANGFTIIKLNDDAEGSDLPAETLGMKVYREPIDTLQQLLTGPDPKQISTGLRLLQSQPRPLFVHCEHGQDRTGLLIGLYRLTEGTNKAAAYQEMLQHGFHPALHGLHEYWEKQ